MEAEPRARVEIEVEHQYPNMRTYVEQFPAVVDAAEEAIRGEGIEPVRTPIRGGTDGSRLSQMGLPTPNISVSTRFTKMSEPSSASRRCGRGDRTRPRDRRSLVA